MAGKNQKNKRRKGKRECAKKNRNVSVRDKHENNDRTMEDNREEMINDGDKPIESPNIENDKWHEEGYSEFLLPAMNIPFNTREEDRVNSMKDDDSIPSLIEKENYEYDSDTESDSESSEATSVGGIDTSFFESDVINMEGINQINNRIWLDEAKEGDEDDQSEYSFDSNDSGDSFGNEYDRKTTEPMKACIRVASWNAKNGLRTKVDDMLQYVFNSKSDYITIQEPIKPDAKLYSNEVARWQRMARGRGYEMICTPNQWVLVKKRLATRLKGAPITHEEGIVIELDAMISNKAAMKIIGVYGVVRETNIDAQKAINNKAKRIKIIKVISKCRSDFYRHCRENNKIPIMIIAGDLQDTITKTDFDNNGNTRLEQHAQGVLKWCLSEEVNMKSLGYEHFKKQEDNNGYITRQGYEGARGIDHIMGNDFAGNLVQGFEIDKHGIHIQVNRSDHHLLMMDLLVGFDWEDSEINETTKVKYGKIYGIPMKMVTQEDSKIPKYVHDTEKRGEELEKDEDHKTLMNFRKAFEENKRVRELEKSIKNRGDKINKEIIELVKHEAREGTNRLPKRNEKMRSLIDKYFEELVEAMQVVMEDLNLSSRITPDSAGHSKKKRKTNSTATIHQSMMRAKSGLNKLHNACTQAIEHTKRLKKSMEKGAIAPNGLIKGINNLIEFS